MFMFSSISGVRSRARNERASQYSCDFCEERFNSLRAKKRHMLASTVDDEGAVVNKCCPTNREEVSDITFLKLLSLREMFLLFQIISLTSASWRGVLV